ncbi:MAG: DNA gyrase subunit A [Verrucomicrobia bacterium CG_4_10_14_3_um_filter_43_23]|nr:MAG: DNA gyrase subunit A [Verrucomicrobia bacterium CG1_02_43_26]PIP59299.1 MAG: DNA gyrase subunit A [Verrucomicrobia bacterium CG22_combo_CG10-13_8_21_14_all_43_17]PIX59189.1 MAG: DNA gyrase subunit A [Verrucomicrobia bacterium CG_4_10_14_3_um_filter_43_23]PIY62200.1 MAG: DNA gyrase subunit A [Verrucomicrobia bacterium CG_4_10_14_0_8_um_filter_43_34]PJA44370.1 MAG: DNA gyrase subunit A [Verrucomicrobia bacterium CG_4_9_14_3_um_filter_43_20]
MYTENEKLISTNITEIMKTAYIDYSMSVIVSRALPDARDGFKPVQRRILYAMFREGLLHNRPFDKCAGVVGEVLKNYHPHSDTAVYDTLVRMAQNWVMRYPIIDPQGNFGSIDGDPPAAYRYTECRLNAIAETLLNDIDEGTVDFVPNYKESTVEPSVLPSALPNLLLNGSTGIAVGMTTNIPPHNLGELIDATIAVINNPSIAVSELIKYIPGPDFPTGGTIAGRDGIKKYLTTGRGIVRIKGTVHSEEIKNGKEQLVITEIPYAVNRAGLVTKIAELVQAKVIDEISDLRDESDENTRIVIELKRGAVPRVLINKLYKHTPLESSFGVILLALDKRMPKQMNIKEMILCYVEHRREVIYRRTQYRKQKAEARAHLLEGYKIALDNLDDFVRIIKAAQNREEARLKLMEKYPLSQTQANAILEMRLYQLTGLEREKIEKEHQELMKIIEEYNAILENEAILLKVILDELKELREKYNTPRRTKIVDAEGEFCIEDVIANEGCIITVSHKGFIKRTSVSSYRSQKRGGKGVIGTGHYDDDFIIHLFTASTHDYIMFFMSNGRVYVEKVYEIPEGSRTAKGRSISNVLELQKDETVAAMICIKEFTEDNHLVMATRKGVVKKTNLNDYANFRRGGIIGINIDEDDELVNVKLTHGHDELVMITQKGMSIRFSEEQLRDQGRATRGVRGISLKEGDCVKAMEVVEGETTLLVASAKGQGKRTDYDAYRSQKRGGSGIIAIKADEVAGALSVREDDEIMLFTHSGQAIRTPVKGIRSIGRTTQGVRLVNLAEDDYLVGISRVIETKEDEA